jgi:hypothetical protein
METESGTDEPAESGGDDVGDALEAPPAETLPAAAAPAIQHVDEALGHQRYQRLIDTRKVSLIAALRLLRRMVIDLGTRVEVAETGQVQAQVAATAAETRAQYYQRLAEAQDHRNEMLVIALVEAVGRLDVAAADLRRVRARIGMRDLIPDPPEMPT